VVVGTRRIYRLPTMSLRGYPLYKGDEGGILQGTVLRFALGRVLAIIREQYANKPRMARANR